MPEVAHPDEQRKRLDEGDDHKQNAQADAPDCAIASAANLQTNAVSVEDDSLEAPAKLAWHKLPAVQRRLRLFARLAEMSPAEILHRIGRMSSKKLARGRHGDAPETGARLSADTLLPQAMAASPTAYLGGRSDVSGFFDLGERDRLVRLARAQLQTDVERTITYATATVSDGIDLLGRWFEPAAADFDWLADPELGRMWPMTVMDDADAVRRARADVKFVWEVNRHQFLVTIARAHAYTGREELAVACVDMVERWIEANPPFLGVNWSSNLEVAIRSISWIWAIHFLLGSEALTDDHLRTWLASLRQHRDYLERHLSTYTDPTNHLVGEAAALAMISMWMPEWEDSERFRELAVSTLSGAVEFQVAEDGVDIEQATSYQRFVLDLILQVIALADRNGIELPSALRSRASAMLEAVAELIGPGHRAPRIGDSDDARGLPFFSEDPWDFGELLATGAAVLGDTTGFSTGRTLTESGFWLGGDSRFPTASAANEPHRFDHPKLLSQGGYGILPSLDNPRGDRLIFDCGPLGYLPHCSHGHADLLSVLVNVGGEEFLIDPGTFAYYDEQGRRDLFRSTRSHNTVEVGGRDQADAFDPFKWLNVPSNGLELWHTGEDFHYAEAWHDGYQRIVPPLRHRRAVITLHGGWLLVDWLEGKGEHRYSRWFHAAPTTSVVALDASTLRVESDATARALLVGDIGGEPGDTTTLTELATAPYSERYGHVCEAPTFRFRDRGSLPAVRMTLLAVQEHHPRGLRLVRSAGSRDAGGLWVELIDARQHRVQVIARTGASPQTVGELTTDGRLGIVTLTDASADERTRFIAGGTSLGLNHAS